MESTLSYTFADLRSDVLEYSGVGRDTEDEDKIAKAGRRVNDAYRNFLMFDWEFLSKLGSLTIEGGKYEYELPDDYGSLRTPFIQYPGTNYYNPTETTFQHILKFRACSNQTGNPLFFATTSNYDAGMGIRYDVVFYPTPSNTVNYIYQYKVMTNELVNDGDIPYCPANLSAVLRAFCLAEVEQFDEDGSNDVWTTKLYTKLLPMALGENAVRAPRTVGNMNISGGNVLVPYHPASGNTININGNTYPI